MIQLVANFLLVVGFMIVGVWLKGIGKQLDIVDRFLTPLPLGLSGIVLVALKMEMT